MKINGKTIVMIALAVVFAVGAFLMIRQGLSYGQAEQLSDDALQLALQSGSDTTAPEDDPAGTEITDPTVPEETSIYSLEPLDEAAQYLAQMDLAALQEVNPDVMGWIYIPGTKINYPLLRADSSEEYLHTAWNGKSVYSGSIFLEPLNSAELWDFNTLIYGHNMANGTMFGNLVGYAQQSFLEEHPYVYVLTEDAIRRYEVYSAYRAETDSSVYRLSYPDDIVKEAAIEESVDASVLESQIRPTAADHILTLSTCTGSGDYSYRWVVRTVLTDIWER